MLRAKLSRRIHHIFLTHEHYDHIMGLTGLIAMLSLTSTKELNINIYGPDMALERARLLIKMVRSAQAAVIKNVDIRLIQLINGSEVDLGPASATAFATSHRESESLGFAFRKKSDKNHKVVFTGDTRNTVNLAKYVKHANWLIVNSNFMDEREEEASKYGHMTVLQAANLAKNGEVERLFIQHLSPRYAESCEEILHKARSVFQETYLAEDLSEISRT